MKGALLRLTSFDDCSHVLSYFYELSSEVGIYGGWFIIYCCSYRLWGSCVWSLFCMRGSRGVGATGSFLKVKVQKEGIFWVAKNSNILGVLEIPDIFLGER